MTTCELNLPNNMTSALGVHQLHSLSLQPSSVPTRAHLQHIHRRRTSWATTPPMKAAMGERSPAAGVRERPDDLLVDLGLFGRSLVQAPAERQQRVRVRLAVRRRQPPVLLLQLHLGI